MHSAACSYSRARTVPPSGSLRLQSPGAHASAAAGRAAPAATTPASLSAATSESTSASECAADRLIRSLRPQHAD
jgi:hypothetical protein